MSRYDDTDTDREPFTPRTTTEPYPHGPDCPVVQKLHDDRWLSACCKSDVDLAEWFRLLA